MARAGLRIEGSSEFFELASWLRAANAEDKGLARRIRKGLREAAKPLAAEAKDALADAMPSRGGLSGIIRDARPGVATSAGGSRLARVEAVVRSPGHDLASMDAGTLRHPTFGRKPWVSQSVRAGAAKAAFEDGMPRVRAEVQQEVSRLLADIAAKIPL